MRIRTTIKPKFVIIEQMALRCRSLSWKRRSTVFVATFLFVLTYVTAIPLQAGSWEIKHKTVKPKIDLQLAYFPNPTPEQQGEIDADCEARTEVGIGEKINLWVEGDHSILGDDPIITWTVIVGNELAGFTPRESDEVQQYKEDPDAELSSLENDILSASLTEKTVTLCVNVTDLAAGDYVRIEVVVNNSETGRCYVDYVEFTLKKPEYWRGRNLGPNDKTYQADAAALYVGTNQIDMYCYPSSVNFENVYYREIDLYSPINCRPKRYWWYMKHETGDTLDRQAKCKAHRITYAEGDFSMMRDNVGGIGLGLRKRKGEPRRPSSAEVKRLIDSRGEHYYVWVCGFNYYDKAHRGKPNTREDIFGCEAGTMEATVQAFTVDAYAGGSGYFTKVTKFGTFSLRGTTKDEQGADIVERISLYYPNFTRENFSGE